MERDFSGRAIIIVVFAEFLKSSADVPLPVIGLFSVPIAMEKFFLPTSCFFLLHVHKNKSINSTVHSICGFKIGQSFFYVSVYCRWVSPFALPCDTISGTITPEITNWTSSLSLCIQCIDVYRAISSFFSLMHRRSNFRLQKHFKFSSNIRLSLAANALSCAVHLINRKLTN